MDIRMAGFRRLDWLNPNGIPGLDDEINRKVRSFVEGLCLPIGTGHWNRSAILFSHYRCPKIDKSKQALKGKTKENLEQEE